MVLVEMQHQLLDQEDLVVALEVVQEVQQEEQEILHQQLHLKEILVVVH